MGGSRPATPCSRLGGHRHLLVALIAGILAAGVFPASASAHAFLIRSQPEAGAHLSTAPGTMTLHFSEPFIAGSQRIEIRRANGHVLKLPPARGRGTVINQPLAAKLRGIFVVSWRVVSIDGHVSDGEFAFAVGATGALPSVSSGSQSTSWSGVAPSWLMFLGLALALGGLLSEVFVWRRVQEETRIAAPVMSGVIVAAAGGVWELVLLAGSERGGGLAAGLHAGAIANALGTRPGGLTLATLIALAVAGVLAGRRALRGLAIAPLLVAVVLNADRGHSGTSGTAWAVAADSVHLATVAIWVGALAHLVWTAARGTAPRPVFVEGVRRYSRFALPTALVVLATGVLTAIPEFRSVDDVVSTSYGKTLLIKSGLISGALLLALAARLRALRGNPDPRLVLLRRLTTAELTTVLAVLIVAAVLVNAAPPRAPAAVQASSGLLGPPPVTGPTVRLADFAGQLIVGLTAGAHELQFTVFPTGYQALGTVTLTADMRQPDGSSPDLFPRPCGGGCFTISVPLQRGSTKVTAHVSSDRWKGGDVRFTIPWPPHPVQPGVITRVSDTMKALRSITYTEELAVAYAAPRPPSTDTVSGRQFIRADLGPGAQDVRSLGTRNGLTEYAFTYPFPGAPIWYRIWIDRGYRLRRELIVAEQGRIDRTFLSFR